MMTRWNKWAVLVLVAAAATACHSNKTAKEHSQPVMVLSRTSGSDASLKTPGVWLFNSQKELDAQGAGSLGKLTDFSKHSLVVLALGEQPTTGYWASITGLQRQGDNLYVQGVANRPAKGAVTGPMMSYPYATAVVSKKISGLTVIPEIKSVEGQAMPMPPATAPAKPMPPTATPAGK